MLKLFFKDTLIYFVPSVLARSVSFLLLPILTRYLSPAEYGFIDLLTALYVLLAFSLPLEVSQAVSRLMVDETDTENKSSLASTSFWFTFYVFAAFGVFAMVMPEVIAEALDGDLRHVTAVRIAGLAMPLNALMYAIQNQLRWSLAAKASSTVGLIFTFCYAGVTVALLSVFDFGVEAMVIGQAIGAGIGLGCGIFFARKHVPLVFVFRIARLKQLLGFSLPLVFSSITYYGATFADRWMINSFMSLEDVGIYAVALKISGIVGIIIASFQMALSPLIYARYKLPETPSEINSLFNYFMLFSFTFLCALSVIAKDLIVLMTDESYHEASSLVVILSAAVVFSGAYVFVPGLSLAKKTKQIAFISFAVMMINLVLNYYFIPIYGRGGAASATLIGGISLFSLFVFLGQRHYRIPYNWLKLIISAVIVTFFLSGISLVGTFVVAVFLFITMVMLLFFILIDRHDRRKILLYIKEKQDSI